MKEKAFNILINILALLVLFFLLTEKAVIYTATLDSLRMWVNSLVPALFPFFIISDILINYNITHYIPKIIKLFLMNLLSINENMLTILLLSMLSGFPSNARNTRILYDKGIINNNEANHILMFSHFANPVFILTTIGLFFFRDTKVGIILLIIHYLSNFILGFCLRGNHYNYQIVNQSNKTNNFGEVLINAIKRAIDTMITICGIVVTFFIISTIIIETFKLNLYNQMLIKGIMEITVGIDMLSKLNIPLCYKLVISSMFLAFGGLSVHMQVLSQITGTKIKYYYFFMGRIYQMIIAGILAYLVCIFLAI